MVDDAAVDLLLGGRRVSFGPGLGRLGCRWLAPDFSFYQGTAEFVPKVETLAVDLPERVVQRPALPLRKRDVGEGISHNAENLVQLADWMAKLRINTLCIPMDQHGRGKARWDNWRERLTPELRKRDMIVEVGGHGYQNFLNDRMEDGRLFERHPEWFGMDESGARCRGRWDGRSARVFCTSNSEAVRYLASNVVEYLRNRPEIQVFDFWPPDGAAWCQCRQCKALGDPADRQAILVNHVRGEIARVRPDVRLECIVYHRCLAPPRSAQLHAQVLVDFCPDAQCFESPISDPGTEPNATYTANLKLWRKSFQGDISIYSYYRKYMWRSLPIILLHYMQADLQFYRAIGVQGIQCYAEPGDWFTYELNQYALAELAWNPSVDIDCLIGRFCEARYGTAAKAAADTFAVLEDVARHCCRIPLTSLKSVAELSRAQARLKSAAAGLRRARDSLADPVKKRHIQRLLLMLEYAFKDIEIQKRRAAKSDTREQEQELAALVAEHGGDGLFLQSVR